MAEILVFNVTRKCLDEAQTRAQAFCAIALGMGVKDPDMTQVRVTQDTVKFSRLSNRLRYTYRTPPVWQVLINEFDSNPALVKPQVLRLNLSKPVHVAPMRKSGPFDSARKRRARVTQTHEPVPKPLRPWGRI